MDHNYFIVKNHVNVTKWQREFGAKNSRRCGAVSRWRRRGSCQGSKHVQPYSCNTFVLLLLIDITNTTSMMN